MITDLNVLAVLAAAVAGFLVSGAWYALLGGLVQRLAVDAGPAAERGPGVTAVVEVVRSLVVAVALVVLVGWADVTTVSGALGLAGLLWVAFPVVLLVGSAFHEGVPWRVAMIHAGDWLVKLAVLTLVVTLWR